MGNKSSSRLGSIVDAECHVSQWKCKYTLSVLAKQATPKYFSKKMKYYGHTKTIHECT